ncbi:MAG TPA: PDDEXK nuclease domain-containing protein [Bacteroidales bacterium]|nr:PDDEXK nuclease domain-containing protein [Bacteroidales bacterium]HPS46195.1 PDDEXK nuclease domain-containing protein [Bacteroidales bacterium]HQH17919.1 PDDEXK nuclease domain-containing protein [Bacteroidales bacterium]HQI44918.1 PDDEXK nuclease domain-containing protein [Bacteroidales bacterium]
MNLVRNPEDIFNDLVKQIRSIILTSRKKVYEVINNESLKTYWDIGKQIIEKEQEGNLRAKYGSQLLIKLSKQLTKDLGKGFSRSNLQNMRNFYVAYPNCQTVSGNLKWSHYCELLSLEDKDKRSFYEQESINSSWSVRELQRQIDTSLFERLLLSDGKANKQTVLKLSQQGQILETATDIIKDPYVFEFLGIPEKKPILEKELEEKLIRHIENFLLELGKGFMFVGSQQRITLGNRHDYVDMVFYNKIIKAYVLIDLKSRKMKHADVGQMNTYLNYYKTEINEETDNAPIGIILCTSKDKIEAEYALGGLSNQIFASTYVLYLPDKEMLLKEVEDLLREEAEE